MDATDIPDADNLSIAVSSDGKWLVFDFKVGEGHSLITMRSSLMAQISEALMAVLRDENMENIPTGSLPHGYHFAHAVDVKQTGTSILPFGEAVVVQFGLSANVQMGFAMTPPDAERLREEIAVAVAECAVLQGQATQ